MPKRMSLLTAVT